jgi:hypothetical protein
VTAPTLLVDLEALPLDVLEQLARHALDELRRRTRGNLDALADDDARRHHADGLRCVEGIAGWLRSARPANDNGG